MILTLKMCFIFGQETAPQKRVIIDVGHGGKDSGAIGINGIQEKDVVLDIALEIVRLNKNSVAPLDIFLTRYADTIISLSDRSKVAKALNADLFVSIHCNHSDNARARGMEVYVGENESEYTMKSIWLAYQLQKQFENQLGFESRGVKFANFQVLRETLGNLSSVLLELGFLSNRDESKYISDFKNIHLLASTILQTIQKF